MSLNDNFTPDPLDQLLRDYLLKHNPTGNKGESLMETAFDHQEISSVPPLDKEIEVVQKLKDQFAPKVEVVPGPASGGVHIAIVSGLAIALSITFFFLFLNQATISPVIENPASANLTESNEASSTWVDLSVESNNLPAMKDQDGNSEMVTHNSNVHPNDANHARKALSDQNRPGFSTGLGNPNPSDAFVKMDANDVSPTLPQNAVASTTAAFPLKDFYKQSTVSSQYFKVDNQLGKVVRAKNGTLLHFPAFCFVNPAGQAVQGVVNVELKEVYKSYEFLLSNLPTVSNGKPLSSAGAIYLNADANGQAVGLSSNRPVLVEFAGEAEGGDSEMQVFQGSYNSRGELNLVPNQTSERAHTMIALNLDQLGFEEFQCDCGKYWTPKLYELTDPSYQQTWIATREFKERIRAIRGLAEDVPYYMVNLLDLYRDNVNLDLWQVDRKAAEFLRDKKRAEKEKGRDYQDELFEEFAAQMLTKVEPFNDYGLNFEDADVRNQLLRKGVKDDEADRLIRVYALTRQYLGNPDGGVFMSRDKKKRIPPKMVAFADAKIDTRHRRPSQGFFLSQMGWSALGKLSGTPSSNQTASLDVNLKGSGPKHTASTYLVVASKKSVLPAREIGNDEARFKDLAPNTVAYLVSIAYENGEPWFGMKKVTLKGNQSEDLALAPTNLDEIVAKLKAIR